MNLSPPFTQPSAQSTTTAAVNDIEIMASGPQTSQHENHSYEDSNSLTDEEKGVSEQQKDVDQSGKKMTLRQKLAHGGPDMPVWKEICFLFVCCCTQLLTQASLGQALVPLHIIGDSFGIKNPGDLSWTIAAYSLTVGTFILIAGRLGDVSLHYNNRLFSPFSFCPLPL